ncbi:MAG: hypothetical protein ACOCQG_01625 [Candidatus Nanoarchaeia archaeon]
MNFRKIIFITLVVISFSFWFYFLENGLDGVNLGTFLLVLFFWMIANIIVTVIGVHEMT